MPWYVLGFIVLILAVVILEGKRQERKYGRTAGRSLMRTGMLEFQRHLEPDRKVEMLLEETEETETAEAGDPPSPGGEPFHDEARTISANAGGAGHGLESPS